MINYNDKKQLIEQLLSVNNMLDTYRANLTILIYNIFSNDKLKQLPKFDYDGLKKLCLDVGNAVIGVKNDYYNKNFNNVAAAENKAVKNVMDSTKKEGVKK